MTHGLPPFRRGFTFSDLLAVLLVAACAAAAIAPAMDAARERDRRIRCASNLRQIGQAIQMYANENRGDFPRTRFDTKNAQRVALFTNWKATNPFADDGPEANDVTAALFLLLRTQDISADIMLCPSDSGARSINFARSNKVVGNSGAQTGEARAGGPPDGEPDPVAALDSPAATRAGSSPPRGGTPQRPTAAKSATEAWPPPPAGCPVAATAQDMSNFPDPSTLSYSYVNPYPSKEAMDMGFKLTYTLTSEFPIAADLNPGGTGPVRVKHDQMPPAPTEPREQCPGPSSAWRFNAAMRSANSPNHGGFGQNVLYADCHAEWEPTPFCGMQRSQEPARDNLYTRHLANAGRDGGDPIVGPVRDPFDSIVLPTAASRRVTPSSQKSQR